MSAYRLTDPNPCYINLLGTESAPDGSLTFYERGTTTPKVTYSDQGLTTPNANPVELDASGRADTEIWLDGEYTVILKDADGTTIWTRDVVPEIAPGLAIPSLTGNTGYFLSNDGSNPIWTPLLQLPDPSGSAGYQVVVNADGTDYILQPIAEPEIPDPSFVITATKAVFTDDDGNKLQLIRGTAATSSGVGTKQATGTVSYETPFSVAVIPQLTATGTSFAPGNGTSTYLGDVSVSAFDANGFTFIVNTNHGESNADGNISGNITVGFFAAGPVA
jgi:hypothetical protein